MKNEHYYTVERNNYFFGKLMTAKDFKNEQNYFNSKRFLSNRMLGGVGIVSGLDVILMDNRTFSLETGMAIDYLGREIVVAEPCIRKLNILRGFEENKEKNVVYLCIEYKEHLSESTFSVASASKEQGGEKQYNRISESYDLFLTSQEPPKESLTLEFLIKQRTEIIKMDGVKIMAETFRYTNSNVFTQVKIFFEKEQLEEPINFYFEISGNFFKNLEDDENTEDKERNKKLKIKYEETEITTYKNITFDKYLYCDAQEEALTEMIIPKESFNLLIGKKVYKLDKNISIPIQIVTGDIRNIIVKDYYNRNFDEILEIVDNKHVYLAKFNLIGNKTTYFIEELKKNPFNQYLYSNELLRILQVFQSENVRRIDIENKIKERKNFEKEKKLINKELVEKQEINIIKNEQPNIKTKNILTGVERINIGFNAKVGKTYYSYEFVHGLGIGNVSVNVSSVNHLKVKEHEKSLLIFGDKSVFKQEELKATVPNVQIAAIVDPNKGTMKLGIRILEKTFYNYVDIRWWVYRPLENKDEEEDLAIDRNVKLSIIPNTVSLKPFEQIRFEAQIDGINDKRIKWELTQKSSGSIDNNGLYNAPATEGVYEIKAYSIHLPEVTNYAYVVVSANSVDAIGEVNLQKNNDDYIKSEQKVKKNEETEKKEISEKKPSEEKTEKSPAEENNEPQNAPREKTKIESNENGEDDNKT